MSLLNVFEYCGCAWKDTIIGLSQCDWPSAHRGSHVCDEVVPPHAHGGQVQWLDVCCNESVVMQIPKLLIG